MTIKKAETEFEYKECFMFFKSLWPDDFSTDVDINAFYQSDVFYIKQDSIITSAIEWFIVFSDTSTYSKRFEYDSIRKTTGKNSGYISRLATDNNYRKQWQARNLVEHLSKLYKDKWIESIYLPCEDFNLNFYKKLWFSPYTEKFQLWDYECVNVEKEL